MRTRARGTRREQRMRSRRETQSVAPTHLDGAARDKVVEHVLPLLPRNDPVLPMARRFLLRREGEAEASAILALRLDAVDAVRPLLQHRLPAVHFKLRGGECRRRRHQAVRAREALLADHLLQTAPEVLVAEARERRVRPAGARARVRLLLLRAENRRLHHAGHSGVLERFVQVPSVLDVDDGPRHHEGELVVARFVVEFLLVHLLEDLKEREECAELAPIRIL